jgi:hypothetical protein
MSTAHTTGTANGTPHRRRARNAARAAARTAANTANATTSPAKPATPVKAPAPARTIVVCVPDDLASNLLDSARNLHRHLGVSGTAEVRFFTIGGLHLWQRPRMIRLTKARPAWCAGGPVRLLNLAGMRDAAAVGANLRHRQWFGAVTGTPKATPWHVFHERHLNDLTGYRMDLARAEFEAQPRVTAMRLHNAAYPTARQLNPDELEILQAGPTVYANYHRMWTVVTDALLTCEGMRLQPASAHLTDWVSYLQQANEYVDRLEETQRLLAITL